MSTHKFGCPQCGQHLEVGDEYAGRKIQCPACQRDMVVPHWQPRAAPAIEMAPPPKNQPVPPPPAPIRVAAVASSFPPAPVPIPVLKVAPVVHAPAPVAITHSPPPPPPPLAPPRSTALPPSMSFGDDALPPEPKAASKGARIAKYAVSAVAFCVAFYFAFKLAGGAQKKFNEARAKDDDPGMIGGQVSHIADLYNVLDATDPAKMEKGLDDMGEAGRPGVRSLRKARSVTVNPVSGGDPAMDFESLPVAPATWTLDVDAAQIPGGRAGGSLAGTNFTADTALLLTGTATPLLALRQGLGRDPEREVLIYLKLKPGERIDGGSFKFAKTDAAPPQVVKRWKPSAAAPLQQKPFATGYALKLEFGKPLDGELPGKIYLALPDAEKTVVAGLFRATIRVAGKPGASASPGAGDGLMNDE